MTPVESKTSRRRALAKWFGLLVLTACSVTEPIGDLTNIERVYELEGEEAVFAYARISPDGRYLAYASEERDSPIFRQQRINVVDLADSTVLFSEPGIDAYWSLDGRRMIYLSFLDTQNRVTIWDRMTGELTRDVAPAELGDYFSWAVRDGEDMILTIRNNYYFLDGGQAVLPQSTVPSCPGIGVGARPLISKDGQRITTFVDGRVVIRNLVDCEDIFETGVPGAKADFSWDGRYVAFHAPKPAGGDYEIRVIDLVDRTIRTITNLSGTSLFPSWTQDGRLMFHHYDEGYRGFMIASDVLGAEAEPLPEAASRTRPQRTWSAVFPETPEPDEDLVIVTVWGPWSAHAEQTLLDLERARDRLAADGTSVRVLMATDPSSLEQEVQSLINRLGTRVPRIPLAPERLLMTYAHNQNPTNVLFRDGVLVDRILGPMTYDELMRWAGDDTGE